MLFAVILALTLSNTQTVEAASDTVVIYEVYGGGDSNGAVYKYDYVVLKNVSDTTQSLDGLYLHKGTAKGAWFDSEKVALKGEIAPGAYFVFRGEQPRYKTNGKELPRFDQSAKMQIASSKFALALTKGPKAPSQTIGGNVIDLVGTNSLNETKPASGANKTTSIVRKSDKDTDDNSFDFTTKTHNDGSEPLDYVNKTDDSQPEDEKINIYINPKGGKLPAAYDQYTADEYGDIAVPFERDAYHTIPVPTKEGYVFTGYDVDEGEIIGEDGNEQEVRNFLPETDKKYKFSKDEIILTAQWEKVLPEESTVTIDPNDGEMLEDKAKTIVKTGDAYTIDFEGKYKFYKDGYHFGGFDVIGDLEDKDGNKVEYIKRADPFTEYYPKGDVTLKVRWKVMQGGQFRAYVKREDDTAFSGKQYKLYLKGTDTEERKFPYGVTKESQTHKMSLLQLKNDSYTLRVEGLADNEYIKEVRLNEDKYTQNQAITKVELKEKDKAEIEIKYDSHFIAPEVNFDVIIGKKPVEETYNYTLTGEGINKITVPGFTRKTEIKLNDVNREGYKFKGWKVEGTLFDQKGNPVTGLITNFDQSYYPGSDVVFTAEWEEVITEAEKASLIIYEVFGGGGKTGSLYANDYVVIKNTGDQPVNLDGMVLRKGISNRWTDQSVVLSGKLDKGAFYVVSGGNDNEADGGKRPVPAVDLADENFNFANRTFALALTTDNNPPSEENTIDLVGTGKATNFEGKQAATGRNNVSLRRIKDGQDTDNNRADFARIEHLRDADTYPLAYLGDKDLRATVTYAFNKAIDGVDIPEAQKVEAGSEITLPEVSQEVKDGYSFLGWAIGDNKNATANLKPGDKITVEEDTNVMGIWEGAYGKVKVTFHTGEFIDSTMANRENITKLADQEMKGAGFSVTNQDSKLETQGKKGRYKGEIEIANGLVKGTYTLNVTAPEGYEIVRIVRDTGSNGVIEIENGSTISLPRPEVPFNLTMADSIYVEVKEKEEEKATVTFAFNKAIDGVDIPEAQKVEVGTEITLPEVSPEVKDGNSFLGWIVNGGKYSTPNLKPGDTITVEEDTNVMGIWEGAYGKVSLTFHTGEFIDNSHENRDKITKLEDEQLVGGGFNVENQQSGQVTEGKKSSSKGKISINNGLVKGTYTLNVTAPEGYEIVRIARDTGSNGVIEIENNSTISLPRPEAPFNLTMADSIYVEVKEKEEEKATVTFEFDKNIDGAKLPDPITVPVGTEIELPKLEEEVLGDYSFMGWELDKAYPNKADANPGDTIKVTEDMTVKGYWEGRYGRFAVHFYEGDYFENKDNLQTLTEGFGFATINPIDKTRLEGVLAGENSKNPYFITPNKAQGGGLTKDAYDLEFTIPEGYKIVSIDKKLADGGLEQVNIGERISPYWYPFNLTMPRGVYVQVEKEEPKIELPEGLYIYEIYGGGGLQQSYYANDYVVLQNKSNTDIDLAGINLHVSKQWRPEYAYNIPLSGTIKANDYFVIKAGAGFNSGEQKDLPRVDLDLSGGKLDQNDFGYRAIGLALTMGAEEPNEKNTIDMVGTYNNNQYLVKPAVSPGVDRSIRRIDYDDVNKTDFAKVSHRPYIEGTAEHREPLWYLRDSQEEKVTVTFKHNVSLENNEVPAEQNVWSGTKITLPQVKEEEKFEFKGWDIDGDGQADKAAGEEFEVKENVTITGIWEEEKPEVKTINFVVDPEKGSATGALFAEVIEGEDPLEKAPKVEAKEGYNFVRWEASEDGLTYIAIFEEAQKPVELIRDRSIRFEVQETIAGRSQLSVKTSKAGDVVVIEINGQEVIRKASNEADVFETYELNRTVKLNDKISVYIIRDKQYKSSKINNIINN